MIDSELVQPEFRQEYARVLRALMSGRITNQEYIDLSDTLAFSRRCTDVSLAHIEQELWPYYCDLRTHRMTDPGHRCARDTISKGVARIILFLRSNAPFVEQADSIVDRLRDPDSFWPFPNPESLRRAVASPTFLSS